MERRELLAGHGDRLTALLLMALSVFISMAPDAAAVLSGVDFSDRAAREGLWNDLAVSLLGPAGAGRHQKASPRLK